MITGVVLAVFAASWALLAALSSRWTDQPQRWAKVPAVVMGTAAAFVLVVAPTGNEAGWVWPAAILALAVWMTVQSRRHLQSRARVLVLYPVFAALALSALGGAYETYRETTDSASTRCLAGSSMWADIGSTSTAPAPAARPSSSNPAWARSRR